jgi:hypothetical protein
MNSGSELVTARVRAITVADSYGAVRVTVRNDGPVRVRVGGDENVSFDGPSGFTLGTDERVTFTQRGMVAVFLIAATGTALIDYLVEDLESE